MGKELQSFGCVFWKWGGKVKVFMSYNNLAINNANFSLEGKLATLWFDNKLKWRNILDPK